jgi:hypothetical protein
MAVACCSARAQNPDIFINIDVRLQFLTQSTGPTFVRFYDNLGRHSTAAVTFYTEAGFQGFVSQKFAKIPHDADRDELDEYYVEDEGIWRLGKQYLPFGAGRFLRESVLAVRGDTQLVFEGLPIAVAACDNGSGRQRGLVGRIGSRLGLSFALGTHFGINATSFTLVRRPEDSPGTGHGYKNAFAVDYSKNAGSMFEFGGELIVLLNGNTPSDHDNAIFDITGTLKADPRRQITVGWTRDNGGRADFYRVMGSFYVSPKLVVEPMLRYRRKDLFDTGVTLHFKF